MTTATEKTPDWMGGASKDDLREIKQIDKQKAKLAIIIRKLSSRRALITNRCIQRARYSVKRATNPTTAKRRRSRKVR